MAAGTPLPLASASAAEIFLLRLLLCPSLGSESVGTLPLRVNGGGCMILRTLCGTVAETGAGEENRPLCFCSFAFSSRSIRAFLCRSACRCCCCCKLLCKSKRERVGMGADSTTPPKLRSALPKVVESDGVSLPPLRLVGVLWPLRLVTFGLFVALARLFFVGRAKLKLLVDRTGVAVLFVGLGPRLPFRLADRLVGRLICRLVGRLDPLREIGPGRVTVTPAVNAYMCVCW